MTEQHTKISVMVMVIKDEKILLGKRKGIHGEGQFASPGGHLEYMESFTECALREIDEECGIEVQNIKFLFVANITEFAPKHYCRVGLIAEWKNGEPQLLEPESCESWDWYDINNLPSPLFSSVEQGIQAYRTGKNFFDI
jgi:8-oxo-dGTP diphosphatase